MDATAALLKELTEAYGAPGYEGPVRALLRERLARLGDISTDRAGNLHCRIAGTADRPRVALVAHMDEIGFMVRQVTQDGFILFTSLGGWLDQVMIGHRVVVHTKTGDVPGVIGGMKPPHVQSIETRDLSLQVSRTEMYIDVGATSREEVESAGVRAGDGIAPRADFEELAIPGAYIAKAFDDRVGCALMVEVMADIGRASAPPNVVHGVYTVMEEIGLRGASTAMFVSDPDAAIILEADVAGDVPNMTPEETPVKLGGGPSLLLFDPYFIPNHRFMRLAEESAAELGIPLQMQTLEGGATDAAQVHLTKSGVPTIVLGVPSRHMHTHGMIMRRSDYDQARQLLVALVRRLDAKTVAMLGEF